MLEFRAVDPTVRSRSVHIDHIVAIILNRSCLRPIPAIIITIFKKSVIKHGFHKH